MGRKKTEDRGQRTEDGGRSTVTAKEQIEALRDVRPGDSVQQWPIGRLVAHPDNPRAVRTDSPKFRELVDSVKANGVYDPLIVRELVDDKSQWREAMGISFAEVLSGHRRLAAAKEAGLSHVPVIHKGVMADDLAYDIVAMANLHEDLTPLEEGRRAALWLDKYGQDARAVASKLGKSERWVMEHAQISRGLSAEWQKEVETNPGMAHWTAGHLAVIAKLPSSQQAKTLTAGKNQYWSWDRMTVAKLEEKVRVDLLYLAKAPFDEGSCCDCVNRTDRQPLLWGDTVEAASGDKARCLDPKCWEKKALRAKKDQYLETRVKLSEKNGIDVKSLVPMSTMEEPDWSHEPEYRAKLSEVKKVAGKIIEWDGYKIVEKGDKGAVPAVVVAGKGKGSLKWIRIEQAKAAKGHRGSGNRPPTAEELAKQKEQEAKDAVWQVVLKGVCGEIARMKQPEDRTVLLCAVRWGQFVTVGGYQQAEECGPIDRYWKKLLAAHGADDVAAMMRVILAEVWKDCQEWAKEQTDYCYVGHVLPAVRDVAGALGIDLEARFNEAASGKGAEDGGQRTEGKGRTGRKGRKKKSHPT